MPFNYYPNLHGFDLREELHNLLYGDITTPGIGRPAILRQMSDTPCACFNTQTNSGNPNCRFCQGEGFQFHEKLVPKIYIARSFGSVLGGSTQIANQAALSPYGFTDPQRAVAYAEFSVYPDYGRYMKQDNQTPDKLYELQVDVDGNMVRPLSRIAKWKVSTVVPHHGDAGRVEYLELGLDKVNL